MWLYFRMNFYVKTDSFIFFFLIYPHLSLCAARGAEMGTRDKTLWIGQFLFRSRSFRERAACFSACNFWGFLGNVVKLQEASEAILQIDKWGAHTVLTNEGQLRGFCLLSCNVAGGCNHHFSAASPVQPAAFLLESSFARADGTAVFS